MTGLKVCTNLCIALALILLLTLAADGRRNGRPRNQRSRKANLDPQIFLERFGYLEKAPDNAQHSPRARSDAIKNFQRMVGLNVTGKMDGPTMTKMVAPRCGNADVIPRGEVQADPMRDGRRNPVNYHVPGYKWSKKDLTWNVKNYSPDMDQGLQRLAFNNAFNYWEEASGLSFQEVSPQSEAEIKIMFASGAHGDGAGNAFDGESGVLAHAYYPEDGNAHFDESETWTWKGEKGTNLQIVAAHEFGHALGLGHSNVPDSLMAPYYQGYIPNFKLHSDDIMGIRSLYGRNQVRPEPTVPSRTRPPRTTSRPTRRPSSKPDTCKTKFAAILQAHDARIYVFNGKWIWRLNDWAVDQGYPVLARKVYNKAPTNIGAAVYSWRTRYTYLFKGNKIFKYYGFNRIERKTIKQRGYPSNPTVAFMSRDGKIYLFQGAMYWEFDEYGMAMTGSPRRISTRWPGLPTNIEAAVRLRDGYLYFIKGSKYRKYDEHARRVMPGYPRYKAAPFMGVLCGGRYVPK